MMILGAILASRGRGNRWRRLVAERLRPILVHERPQLLRWFSFGTLLLGFAFLIAALTTPNAGFRDRPDTIRGRNIILAVDVSRSMLATDETPNRIGAARAAALELLDRFPNDRIGVIAFSGVAWLQAPLTVDHGALREAFHQLEFQDTESEWIPRSGSDLPSAVKLATKSFKETGQRNNALIILSDGESHGGGIEDAAEVADEAGVAIFTAGFGTDEGSFIPDAASRDGKLHDPRGNLVLSRLNSESLSLLARRTGGFYTTGSGPSFSANLELAVQRLDQFEMEGSKRLVAIPCFQWFLVPSMVLFVVGMLLNTTWNFSTRQAAALLVALAVFSPRGEAGLLPRTPAGRAYHEGDHQRALELFEQEVAKAQGNRRTRLLLGEAAAAYRLQNFGRASHAYSGALLSSDETVQEHAHYGLGNTQFYKGLALLEGGKSDQPPGPQAVEATIVYWRDSIGHFDGVLRLNPENERARQNRDRVLQRLQDLRKKQEEQREAQPPPEPDPDPEKKDPDQGGKTGDPNQSPPDDPKRDPGESPPAQPEDPENPDPDPRGANGEDEPKPAESAPSPRPGETPEEFARRILGDNADFDARPVPLRFRNLPRAEKDW